MYPCQGLTRAFLGRINPELDQRPSVAGRLGDVTQVPDAAGPSRGPRALPAFGAAAAPGSLESLRRRNRERVLSEVRRRGATSRVDIVRETGLSRSTVSSLVGGLITEGLLVERPERSAAVGSSNGGRPAIVLTLNPVTGGVVGVHFGHNSARIALADLSGQLIGERLRELDVDHDVEATLTFAADSARELMAEAALGGDRLLGCGVAVSTPVHPPGTYVSGPSLLTDWRGVDIAGELRNRLGTPVLVGNDANLGAVAEWTFGAGRGVDNLIYVMVSDGLGAGLILNGHLFRGGHDTAGEFGHVVVAPNGSICRCGGRGCLETIAGGRALVEALAHRHGGGLSLEDAVGLAAAGDAGAQRVFSDCGRAVGEALAGICSVLDPSLVIVGGKASAVGATLLDGVRDGLSRRLPPSIIGELPVVAGQLEARAEVLGAIALVTRKAPSGA